MLNVNGVSIDFDITAPADLRRYRAAGEKMAAATAQLPVPPASMLTEAELDQYISFLEAQCRLITDFVDEAFGNDVCNHLLGAKTSLDKLLDMCDQLGVAVEQQGQAVGVKIAKYTPNRAGRRAKK